MESASFEPFLDRRGGGAVQFANKLSGKGAFRQRCWPVLLPTRRRRRKMILGTWRSARMTAAIDKAARVSAARRWLPSNPLLVHVMQVEDTRRARLGR